jgi:hypothetical protein
LNDLLSTEYRLDVSGISNHRISYVRVPRTKSDSSFRNSKEWLDTAIEISGSKDGGTFESAYRITNHIIRYYHDSFLAACETQRVPVCNPMSATEFQAMMSAASVSGTGERELKKHLGAKLGKGFCPTRRSVDMLSDGHTEVHYGSIEVTATFGEQINHPLRSCARPSGCGWRSRRHCFSIWCVRFCRLDR